MAKMAFYCPCLLLVLGLMLNAGTALIVDFTINATTLYDQDLTCRVSCNELNSSNINGIFSISIFEVHATSERKISMLSSILGKPIIPREMSTTKSFGMLQKKEGLLEIGVKANTNVLKYVCRATFYDEKLDLVQIEKEKDNKANVLVSMLNQRFAGIASGVDFDTTLKDIEKKFEETLSKISEAVAKLSNKIDTRFEELLPPKQTIEQIEMVNETRQKTEEPASLVTSCYAFRSGAVPASSPLMPITLPDSTPALCDTFTDGGGWTIFQRRVSGDVDFYRNWTSYEEGFGNVSTNYWLGLKTIRSLMYEGPRELRVDIEFNGKRYYAKYSQFSIGDAESNYKLHVTGYSGNAGNDLGYHNGMGFSTLDRDNDEHDGNCAKSYAGAWWYKNCHRSNLNGEWGREGNEGPVWRDTTGTTNAATFTEMKTRLVV